MKRSRDNAAYFAGKAAVHGEALYAAVDELPGLFADVNGFNTRNAQDVIMFEIHEEVLPE